MPKPEISRDEALKMWMDTHSDYAKEQLILNHVGLVYHCMMQLGIDVNNEDMFQEGMIGLVKAIDVYIPLPDAKFSTFAWKCIRNNIIDCLRKNKNIQMEVLGDANKGFVDEKAESVLDDCIIKLDLKKFMDQLSKDERICVEMCIKGFSQEETARKLNMHKKKVSRIMISIRARIRQQNGETNCVVLKINAPGSDSVISAAV